MSFARLFLAAGVAATALGSSVSAIAAVPAKAVSVLELNDARLPVDDVRKSKRLRRANNAVSTLGLVLIGAAVVGTGVAIYAITDDDEPASP